MIKKIIITTNNTFQSYHFVVLTITIGKIEPSMADQLQNLLNNIFY